MENKASAAEEAGENVSILSAVCSSVMYSMCVGHKVYFRDVICGWHFKLLMQLFFTQQS